MPKGDPQEGFFYPTLTLMIYSYNLTRDSFMNVYVYKDYKLTWIHQKNGREDADLLVGDLERIKLFSHSEELLDKESQRHTLHHVPEITHRHMSKTVKILFLYFWGK